MAIVTTDNAHYQNIASKIREKKGTNETIFPSEMPQKVDEVYTAGYEKGKAEADTTEAYEQGVMDGKQAEYSRFWDSFQDNGEKRNYERAFCSQWTKEAFKPKYDLIVGRDSNNYGMFHENQIEGSLTKILNDLGIILRFEGGYSSQTFAGCLFTEIDISTSKPFSTWSNTFSSVNNLKTLKLPEMKDTCAFTSPAFRCPALENLTLSGVIGTSINFQYSPLTPESMKNVIQCLYDYSGTDKAYVNKVTFTEQCWAALEADSTAPNGDTWADYVDSLGWIT